jgi:hypothetical protein
MIYDLETINKQIRDWDLETIHKQIREWDYTNSNNFLWKKKSQRTWEYTYNTFTLALVHLSLDPTFHQDTFNGEVPKHEERCKCQISKSHIGEENCRVAIHL